MRVVDYQRATIVPDITGTIATTLTFDGGGGTTGSITLTAQRRGQYVTLQIPAVTGTSGTGSTALVSNTALAAAFRPLVNQFGVLVSIVNNNAAVAASGAVQIGTGGIVTLLRDSASTTFTNTSVCGTAQAQSVTYFVG